jgi:3'-5' exoribonuclease
VTEEQRVEKVKAAMAYLRVTADVFLFGPYQQLCLTAIEEYDQGFGGLKHHHNYVGGLAVHVADVVRRCLELGGIYQGFVDREILLTAAYWYDHEKLSECVWKEGERFEVTAYAKLTGHVVGSTYALIQAAPAKLPKLDQIIHCMLAHHGRREWGSPVEPATNEAWILHSAVMLSSREVG